MTNDQDLFAIFSPRLKLIIPAVFAFLLGCQMGSESIRKVVDSERLTVLELDENLYQHTSFLKSYNGYPCNGAVYVNGGQAIVFDTPTDSASSAELLDWISDELDCEVIGIVVNHFHVDCTGGLHEFHRRNIPSYANFRTIEHMDSEGGENTGVRLLSFEDSLRIEVGKSSVLNVYMGPGHTADNIVSFIPEKKALFGGCLVKARHAHKGNLNDAVVEEWSTTVRKVKSKYGTDVKIVIPGHGMAGGVELLDYTIELFGDSESY